MKEVFCVMSFPLYNKTLILRLSSIGDILLTSPLLRIFRKAVGNDVRVDFVVKKEFAELINSNHHLSIVHELDRSKGLSGLRELKERLREEQYDLIIDIHDNLRTRYLRSFIGAKKIVVMNKRQFERWVLVNLHRNIYKDKVHVADRYIETVREFGIENDGKGLEIFIPDTTLFSISGKIAKLRLNLYNSVIGICPGAKHFTKRWQKEKFAEVGVRVAKELNAKIILFGGKAEFDDCNFVAQYINEKVSADTATNFAGEFSLLETAAAMEFCDVVLTNDSGLMHLATAKQKNVIAIFGSTVKEFGFAPYGTDSVVIERQNLACRPCSHIGRADCPKKHFHCMKEIGAEEVWVAVKKSLQHES